ncbi:uncharacterized protein LOC126674281 [Mercurialis annua]|uniref:uncharacterized protein LOC126674281 n=1 Tax=Mercurialis annua TaxID=3986 RepID=UPI00215E0ABA|nr:uncharacterized protein LOC126674281 [Mercurialis annua]
MEAIESKIPIKAPNSNSNKKRKLGSDVSNLYSSPFFKIRALLPQLRPQFLQVLETPDFQNCKAAHELQIQMKHLMNLYKQMTVEINPVETPLPTSQPLSGENVSELLQHKQLFDKFSEENNLPQVKANDIHPRQSYMVGSSDFDRNFITFKGGKPVYNGVTKESFRETMKSKMSSTCTSSNIT